MNREYLMILSMGICGVLFALGGTGFKWARRFVMPFILAVIALFCTIVWWKCLAMAFLMAGALCLPYGERTPYWGKFLVGCAFVAPTLFLGFTWWQVITPIAFIIMFKLSNISATNKVFLWKIVEFLTGVLIGATFASLIG